MLGPGTTIGVLGAGTMGAGIAQVAACAGHPVVLGDAVPEALARAEAGITRWLARDVEKGRRTADDAAEARDRIRYVYTGAPDFAAAGIVIEAIVEDLAVKRDAFGALARIAPDAILATNTSSLSVTAIAAACPDPSRVLGLHFFNPVPLMGLVEVVAGDGTDAAHVQEAAELVRRWGKTAVLASDTPGFIVNRVARPYYGEALRIMEEGIADCATIDWAMRELGGFRMGPFELMDLIGNDVNYAVTRSVFEASGFDPRYRPSLTQRRMVDAGRLGRKSGRGYYEHGDGAQPPAPTEDQVLGRAIVDRIVAMLINEAVDALVFGVASRDDIDLAMTTGVNYPQGLFRWADAIGVAEVFTRVEALHREYAEERYRPSVLLRRMAADGRSFYP